MYINDRIKMRCNHLTVVGVHAPEEGLKKECNEFYNITETDL